MEWVIIVAVVVGGYLVAQNAGKRRQDRLALRSFSHTSNWTETSGQYWEIDLVEMKFAIKGFDYEYDRPDEEPLIYSIRRKQNGQWQCLMSEASREKEIQRLLRESLLAALPRRLTRTCQGKIGLHGLGPESREAAAFG